MGRPSASTAIQRRQLLRREQKLQHGGRTFGPGALAVIGAAILEIDEVRVVAPPLPAQQIAERTRVVQTFDALASAHIEPDAGTLRRGEVLDVTKNRAVVPPD